MIEQEYFRKILNYFSGDTNKTWLWFKTENPLLGGISPLQMIKNGRSDKLKKFINTRLEGRIG